MVEKNKIPADSNSQSLKAPKGFFIFLDKNGLKNDSAVRLEAPKLKKTGLKTHKKPKCAEAGRAPKAEGRLWSGRSGPFVEAGHAPNIEGRERPGERTKSPALAEPGCFYSTKTNQSMFMKRHKISCVCPRRAMTAVLIEPRSV